MPSGSVILHSTAESITNGSSNRACQNCARAKAKCVPQSGDQESRQCARCFRLRKECTVLPRAARKRRAANTVTTTAQLEQKIESLVNLLSNAHGANPSLATPPQSLGQSEPSPQETVVEIPLPDPNIRWAPESVGYTHKTDWQQRSTSIVGQDTVSQNVAIASRSQVHSVVPIQDQCPRIVGSIIDSRVTSKVAKPASAGNNGDRLLKMFRQCFEHHFPFVAIPPNISSDDLQKEKPWLHRSILMVASYEERGSQLEAASRLMMDISGAMLLRGEKSLDMLQSMIIYNAWAYYCSPVIPSKQSCGIFQLTMALLFDLNLTKPFRKYEGPCDIMIHDEASKGHPSTNLYEQQRTLDERRALLACYVLFSILTIEVKKSEGLQHSAYIEFCCDTLEKNAEAESDVLLVALARVTSILQPVEKGLTNAFFFGEHGAPIWMHMKGVRAGLQSHFQSLPDTVQQNHLMLMCYNSAQVMLYEPALQKDLPLARDPTVNGLDMLYGCMVATQTLLDGYVALKESEYYGFTMVELAHMGRGITTMMKLSLLEEPGWDKHNIRQTLNIGFYLDHLLGIFERVGSAMDRDQRAACRDSFPTGCARAMKRVRAWYESKLELENEQGKMQEPASMEPMEYNFTGDPFEYWDERNLLALMGDDVFPQL